jgi:hypothetical protein
LMVLHVGSFTVSALFMFFGLVFRASHL